MNKIITLLLAVVIFSSCKTNQLTLSVTEPAVVNIPGTIKKVGIINRSMPSTEAKPLNKIDEILTGEGPELDKEGSKESVIGLADELKNNERFSKVTDLSNLEYGTTASGIFPAALDWQSIEKICKENEVDAVFSLEMFDTDTKISYSNNPTNVRTPLGNIPMVEHQANMLTTVKTGWRIYDPQSKYLLDEFTVGENISFSGRGINPVIAAAGLIGRKDAVKQVANKTGHNYAGRILPYLVTISREYYIKGTPSFAVATRKARTGKWNEAAELWKKETNNSSTKIAGRACYNMAIASEINGNLDLAIEWAQKAYEVGGKKMALQYVDILKYRKVRNNRLEMQQEQSK